MADRDEIATDPLEPLVAIARCKTAKVSSIMIDFSDGDAAMALLNFIASLAGRKITRVEFTAYTSEIEIVS